MRLGLQIEHSDFLRNETVDILVKNTKAKRDDAEKNYDLWYGPRAMMARRLGLPAEGIQAYLDVRNSTEKPEKYLDMTYAEKALAGLPAAH